MNITTKIGSNEYNQWKIITPSSFHHTLQYREIKGPRWLNKQGSWITLYNSSCKPITNMAWVRARFCKLQKGCTGLAAANDKFTSCLPMVGGPASSSTNFVLLFFRSLSFYVISCYCVFLRFLSFVMYILIAVLSYSFDIIINKKFY